MAWKKGMKSLYYCRSLSIARADAVSEKAVGPQAFAAADAPRDGAAPLPLAAMARGTAASTDYEECLACQ